MNNSSQPNSTANRTFKDGSTDYDLNRYIITLSIQLATLLLQLTVQYIIHKARLRDNQYQLIRLESILESLNLITYIILITDAIRRNNERPDKRFLRFLTFLAHLWSTLSIISTVFISVDRWAAVKFSLRYHAMITKQKLGGAFILVALLDASVLCCMIYIGDVTNTILKNSVMFTSRAILAYIASLKAVCCIIIIVLGKKTIQYRNDSEARIRGLNNLHGRQEEELDLLVVLKRGINDVIKVNFWTCIFLIPTILTLFIISTSGTNIPRLIFGANTVLLNLQMTSSPIIYLTCYSKIRNVWTRLFRRQRVLPGGA